MLSYKFRYVQKHVKGVDLAVLINLICHRNMMNRAWPSVETIAKETGYNRSSVIPALKRLQKMGAFELVAVQERAKEERYLPPASNVYQLTGFIIVDGERYEYLYSNDGKNNDRSNNQTFKGLKIRPDHGLKTRPKGNTVLEDNTEEVNTSTSAPLGAGEAAPKTKRKRKSSEHSKRIEVLVRQLVSDDALEYDDLTDAQLAQYGRFANKLWGRELKELHLEGDITPADLAAFVTARDGLALPLADGLLGRRYAEWLAKGKEVRRGDNGEALEPAKQYEAVTDEDGNTYMREVK